MANELVLNQGVDLLAGTYLSPSGLAVANYAEQKHVLFVATEPLSNAIVWEKGSRYVFRVENPVSMITQALAEKAAGFECKKWGGTGPVSEAITDMVRDFRADMTKLSPNFQWGGDILTPIGQFNAGSAIAQFQRNGVDCVINAQSGPDLVAFVREAKARGFFDKVKVVSLQTGIPEWLNSLGAEAPVGWIVNGYPVDAIPWPEHKAFVASYTQAYGDTPTFGSFIGYLSIEAIVAGIQRAGSTKVEDMIKGFRGAEFNCIIGHCRWRMDHQLNLGVWIGGIQVDGKKASMVDWTYITAEHALPSEADGVARRPAAANQ
jgi:branched-chain amino acid transport system substrate-binding protein